jgi:hypothetical protein
MRCVNVFEEECSRRKCLTSTHRSVLAIPLVCHAGPELEIEVEEAETGAVTLVPRSELEKSDVAISDEEDSEMGCV